MKRNHTKFKGKNFSSFFPETEEDVDELCKEFNYLTISFVKKNEWISISKEDLDTEVHYDGGVLYDVGNEILKKEEEIFELEKILMSFTDTYSEYKKVRRI